MSHIQTYQKCHTTEGWHPIKVQSTSDPGTYYIVLVSPWNSPEEFVCECQGYIFRGTCKHQAIAADGVCWWSELVGPEVQSAKWRKEMRCPRCVGPTVWAIHVEEEDAPEHRTPTP